MNTRQANTQQKETSTVKVPVPLLQVIRTRSKPAATSTPVRPDVTTDPSALSRYLSTLDKEGFVPGAVVIKVSSAQHVISSYDYGVVMHQNSTMPRQSQYAPLKVKWVSPTGGTFSAGGSTDEWPDDLMILHPALSNDARNNFCKLAQERKKN